MLDELPEIVNSSAEREDAFGEWSMIAVAVITLILLVIFA